MLSHTNMLDTIATASHTTNVLIMALFQMHSYLFYSSIPTVVVLGALFFTETWAEIALGHSLGGMGRHLHNTFPLKSVNAPFLKH